MTLAEILQSLCPFANRDGFDSDAVQAYLDATGRSEEIIQSLTDAMVRGELTAEVWRGATHDAQPDDFERAFARLWEVLWNSKPRSEAEGFPQVWTKSALRLWAYTESWLLISQDEDLLLSSEQLIPALLEIAAERECPKAKYILEIAEHSARDRAFWYLGKDGFCEAVARIGSLAPAVAHAGDEKLAAYFVRLASYGLAAAVSEADAVQRAVDLTRCTAPTRESVIVRREADDWLVALPGIEGKKLLISSVDGRNRVLPK